MSILDEEMLEILLIDFSLNLIQKEIGMFNTELDGGFSWRVFPPIVSIQSLLVRVGALRKVLWNLK